jgi:hypothetical protein
MVLGMASGMNLAEKVLGVADFVLEKFGGLQARQIHSYCSKAGKRTGDWKLEVGWEVGRGCECDLIFCHHLPQMCG